MRALLRLIPSACAALPDDSDADVAQGVVGHLKIRALEDGGRKVRRGGPRPPSFAHRW